MGMKPHKKLPSGKLWLYGWHAVLAALANDQRHYYRLLITAEQQKEFSQRSQGLCGAAHVRPEIVDKPRLNKILGQQAVHQGIALEVRPLDPITLDDLKRMITVRNQTTFVMLDQVTDPHNVGAIMRSAAALGAKAMILQNRYAPEMQGALAKAASGAIEEIQICEVVNLSRAITELKEAGCVCFALDEGGQDITIIQQTDHMCLVMGAEGDGLRPSVKEACDGTISLPTESNFTTLNVSNAAAVALYERRRSLMS